MNDILTNYHFLFLCFELCVWIAKLLAKCGRSDLTDTQDAKRTCDAKINRKPRQDLTRSFLILYFLYFLPLLQGHGSFLQSFFYVFGICDGKEGMCIFFLINGLFNSYIALFLK